jgi:hypothetical protein
MENKPLFEMSEIDDVRIIVRVKNKNYAITPNKDVCTSEFAKDLRISLLNLVLQYHCIVNPAIEDITKEQYQNAIKKAV